MKPLEGSHYEAMASRLDDPPDQNPFACVLTCSRRLGALLEDEFDATGESLLEKTNSVKLRISKELMNELRGIAIASERMSGDAAYQSPHDARSLQERCEQTISDLMRQAPRVTTPNESIAQFQWTTRHPVISGAV